MANDAKPLPTIEFSEWHRWQGRQQVANNYLPGVYLLARFAEHPPPDGHADPLDERIVYIGETRRSLLGRWGQFDRDRFHSGGRTYWERYPYPDRALYVAAMTCSPTHWMLWARLSRGELAAREVSQEVIDELEQLKTHKERSAGARGKGPLNGAWIKFVERKLILDFLLKSGKLPECNKE